MAGKQLVQGCYTMVRVEVEHATFALQGRTLSTEPRRHTDLELTQILSTVSNSVAKRSVVSMLTVSYLAPRSHSLKLHQTI